MSTETDKHYSKRKILFVCLGNICRSPSAEEVMRTLVKKRNLDKYFILDSAGTSSYHKGEMPDPRMRAYASRRGYQLSHLSRPVRIEDFYDFDIIIGMDDSNIDNLREMAPSVECMNKIRKMTDFCIRMVADHVPDPYYDGGFDNVIDILEDACEGLLNKECKVLKD